MAASVWKDEFVIRIYELARSGMTERVMAKVLGISIDTFRVWERKKKYFKLALEAGRKQNSPKSKEVFSFQDYVYKRLSKEYRKLWEEINAFGTSSSGVEKMEALLTKKGKRARQHLFLYAWTSHNFSVSYALRKVNISRSTFDLWRNTDPGFADMVNEIDWHKENFFEDHLIQLIAGGDTSAILHVAKTKLRKRGYGEKTEIDLNMGGSLHTSLGVDNLDIPLATKKVLLAAVRKKKKNEKEKAKNNKT